MKAFAPLALLLLAGCTSTPVPQTPPLPELPALRWRLSGGWREQAPQAYEPAGQRTFLSEAGEVLQVRAKAGLTLTEAAAEAKLLRQKTARLLEPQVDPYYGAREQSEHCDPARAHQGSEGPEGFSARYLLAATNRLVLECYNAGAIRFHAQVLQLYCASARAFFELRYFQPIGQAPRKEPVAGCAEAR